MNGIWNLLKRVIPIITLICFICLGITHTFSLISDNNITYMSKVYYDTETWQVIENPTEEQQENAYTYYSLDTINYMSNINADNLKNSTQNIFNFQAFKNVVNNFNTIWEDGYQFGDGVRTIINGILLMFNGLLTAINGILWPVRIVSAIFLTAFSIVGININNGGIICSTLQFFVDELAIPLINPVNNVETNTTINGVSYKFLNSNLQLNTSIWSNNKYFYFESNGIEWSSMNDYSNKVVYGRYEEHNPNQITLTVYENGQWINQAYRNITILDKNTLNNEEVTEITTFLNNNCIDQTLINTSWQWTTLTFTNTIEVFQGFKFTSNNENFTGLGAGLYNNDNQIAYQRQGQNSLLVYSNSTWLNANYQYFTITNENEFSQTDTQNLTSTLLGVYCTQI